MAVLVKGDRSSQLSGNILSKKAPLETKALKEEPCLLSANVAEIQALWVSRGGREKGQWPFTLGLPVFFSLVLLNGSWGVRGQKRDRLITQGQICAEDKGNKDAPESTTFTVPVSEDVVPGAVPSSPFRPHLPWLEPFIARGGSSTCPPCFPDGWSPCRQVPYSLGTPR